MPLDRLRISFSAERWSRPASVLLSALIAATGCSDSGPPIDVMGIREPSDLLKLPRVSAPAELTDCGKKVDDWVRSTKRWAAADFRVVYLGSEGDVEEFDAVHVADLRRWPPEPGGGITVRVQIDCLSAKVTRELGYQ